MKLSQNYIVLSKWITQNKNLEYTNKFHLNAIISYNNKQTKR